MFSGPGRGVISHKPKIHFAVTDMDSFGLKCTVGRQVQLHQLLLVYRNAHFHELL